MSEWQGNLVTLCFVRKTPTNIAVGIFLIAGALFTYLPQYIAIVRRKSSHGISFWMLLLGLASAAFTGVNAGMMNWDHITCCSTNNLTFGQCLANNLSFIQLFFLFFWYVVMVILFIVYCGPVPSENFSPQDAYRTRQRALVALVAVNIIVVALCTTGGYIHYRYENKDAIVIQVAELVGYVGALLMMLQFLPQIYQTIVMRSPGALSLLSLAIGIPGQLLTVIFQGILNQQNMSVWLPAFFAFLEMSFLLIICFVFKCSGSGRDDDEEDTQLLRSDSSALLVQSDDSLPMPESPGRPLVAGKAWRNSYQTFS